MSDNVLERNQALSAFRAQGRLGNSPFEPNDPRFSFSTTAFPADLLARERGVGFACVKP